MIKKNTLLTVFLSIFFLNNALAQKKSLWKNPKTAPLFSNNYTIAKTTTYTLDVTTLQTQLQQAPLRSSNLKQKSSVTVDFPLDSKTLETFEVFETPVMHPDLAAKYPEIKSYTGKSIENPSNIIKFTLTSFGFHGMILSTKGTIYINPQDKEVNTYQVFSRKNIKQKDNSFECLVEDMAEKIPDVKNKQSKAMNANDGTFRTFRLALACTGEYAQYHVDAAGVGAGTDNEQRAAVLAAMNVTMNRVNGIFERDLSITMEIVANNDLIIYLDAVLDPYFNEDGGAMLGQNQGAIDTEIGTANYDIGHVFSTGGGGVAYLDSPCDPFSKAGGVTGQGSPVGDPFDVDYVAHEMGHQYGANHTQNNSCQRNNATAVEPGSASTIMGYAGICSPNVQSNSDAHFHVISIQEMFDNITVGTSTCADAIPNGNTPPVADAGLDYTIPHSTPFVLQGQATDVDDPTGNSLTYCWEQTDNEIATMPPLPTSVNGPNFRSRPPSVSSDRYMPQLNDVLNGSLTPTWEVVPSVARSLNFALTVRDNAAVQGGQTNTDEMIVTTANVGPFQVTSQNVVDISYNTSDIITVTWDVAGTDANGINTVNVNILLSLDGGQTFTENLALSTPNDGSEDVTLPVMGAPFCRIRVEPVDNIYYAINTVDFAIGYDVTTVCNTYDAVVGSPAGDFTNNEPPSYDGWGLNIADDVVISDINVTVDISHTYISDLLILLQSPLGTQVQLAEQPCGSEDNLLVTFDNAGGTINCGNTTNGDSVQPAESLSVLEGESSAGDWIIGIADVFAADDGTLNEFSIEICTVQILANEEVASADEAFKIYPNPSVDKTFAVSFQPNSNDDIVVDLFTIDGKQVYNSSYKSNGFFNETINVENLSTGIYLLKVSNGEKVQTGKIVIN